MPRLPNTLATPITRRDRRLALAFVLLGIFIFAFRLTMWQGWFSHFQAARIAGGSMGANLPGEHVRLTCVDCRFSWIVDAASWQRCSDTVCPNCCWTRVERQDSDILLPGQRVMIDRAAYTLSSPQRFEVVAFQQPGTNNELAVKRVVGLPGETVSFHRGDLYVNEKLVRKTAEQFRGQALLMHDDRYRKNEYASFWNGWQTTTAGHTWQGQSSEEAKITWLNHVRTQKFGMGIEHSAPLRDHESFHAASFGGSNKLTDFALEGSFQITGHAKLHFQLHDGYTWHERTWSNPQGASAKSHKFLFGYWDQTLWFLVDEKIVSQTENKPRTEPSPEHHFESQLKIGGAGEGSITLSDLQIWRDLYYLSPTGVTEIWQVAQPLPDNEYFLLGDNQPLSIDSRHWEQGIKGSEMLGKIVSLKK